MRVSPLWLSGSPGKMLEVWTARISTKDPDAFNITRKSGHKEFAPSWEALQRMLEIRRSGRVATEEEWREYVEGYLKEMGRSHRVHKASWDALLARERVVLVCYCTNPQRCHRTILARILESLGAVNRGELPTVTKSP